MAADRFTVSKTNLNSVSEGILRLCFPGHQFQCLDDRCPPTLLHQKHQRNPQRPSPRTHHSPDWTDHCGIWARSCPCSSCVWTTGSPVEKNNGCWSVKPREGERWRTDASFTRLAEGATPQLVPWQHAKHRALLGVLPYHCICFDWRGEVFFALSICI